MPQSSAKPTSTPGVSSALTTDAHPIVRSAGARTLGTATAIGATVAPGNSNVVHPTIDTVVGAPLCGGPIGLAVGALSWAIAHRTLVLDRR
jgi:hypothetical protein